MQATTEQRMQRLIEAQAGWEERMAHSEKLSKDVSEAIVSLVAMNGRLTNSQERLDEKLAETDQQWKAQQAEADARWKAGQAEIHKQCRPTWQKPMKNGTLKWTRQTRT